MDSNHFDALARSLGLFGASRRTLTQIFAGSAVAAVLARFVGADVAAKCVKLGKKCKTKRGKKKCCGGAKCKGKKCKCPEGQIDTGDECVTGAGTCSQQPEGACSETCNDSPQCVCHVTYERWLEGAFEFRCGDNSILSQCGECTTDAECASYGPGSFCAIALFNAICGGCAEAQGFCRTPCPS